MSVTHLDSLRAHGRSPQSDRFLLYSHDGLGLGHVSRNLAIASALTELAPRAAVLVATGVEALHILNVPAHVDILKLPGLCKLGTDRYVAKRLPLSTGDVGAIRMEVLAGTVKAFRPRVLLVDTHPLGINAELTPALELGRATGVRAVLGLADVFDDPATLDQEWRAQGAFARIPEHYDRVLVYGQPELFDPLVEYAFPEDITTISAFCGYVVSPPRRIWRDADETSPFQPRRPRVLATAGEGEDGFALLEMFIEAAAHAEWQAMVVAGPQCPAARAEDLQALCAETGVVFRHTVKDLSDEFASLDALVCMGGYNTLAEAAVSGTPTICVPRTFPTGEQLARARIFERQRLLRLVEPAQLTPVVLRAEIEEAIQTKSLRVPAARTLDFDGAWRAARHLLEIAAEAAAADPAVTQAPV
jgi:predicted glycosyltransferase